MKHLITILTLILFANTTQAQDYSDLWKAVENNEAEGLTKSALQLVEEIAEAAEKDNNTPQQIKALLFKSKYALTLEEDAQLNIINNFKSQITKAKAPTKNVLENMLAHLYWQYFQQNRWRFYDRTNTSSNVDANDFRTWDLQALFEEIHRLFQNSLQNALILQLVNLESYDAIIIKAKDSRVYRPTLYDLLAHHALEFYKTDENSIVQPAYKFKIDDSSFLEDAKRFANLNIASKDSISLQLHALKLYQALIKFHLKDKSPEALVDVDLQRLNYVHANATYGEKDERFINALKNAARGYNNHAVSGLYLFEIAQQYFVEGSTYDHKTNPDVRWKTKEAFDLAQSIIKSFPESKAAQKSLILQAQIQRESLQIQIENHLPVNKDSKLLVRYTNINQLHLRIYKLTYAQRLQLNKTYRNDRKLRFIENLPELRRWNIMLPDEKDYQSHSTEILFPPLPNGHYVVLASDDDKITEDAYAFTSIQVTDLAIVEKGDQSHHIYQIIDRNNGQPIAKATVNLTYQRRANRNATLISNTQGEVKLSRSKDRSYGLNIRVKSNDDVAHFDNYYTNHYYREDQSKTLYKTFIFTDRSLYRPGQTVYFKGIALTSLIGKSEVLVQENVAVKLINVNQEEIGKVNLKTNEFGAFSGEFVLPTSGITGDYHIKVQGTSVNLNSTEYFAVEEYKRPKFETQFLPVTETFKVNDSITITGTAQAYAGSHITDAKVVYRVHRKVQLPRWYYWQRPWFNSIPQEIAYGEMVTDNKGQFVIKFKALPDESVDKKNLPVFQYEVTADVTDLNGETRSATSVVHVGYHALMATIVVEQELNKDEKDNVLTIETRNLNGEFVPSKGTVNIYKLQAPQRVLRKRPWEAPDIPSLNRKEFIKYFPNEAYANEDDSNFWVTAEQVFVANFDTEVSNEVALGNMKKWTSGQYKIVLKATDKFGQDVKDEAKTTLFSKSDKSTADKQLFSITHQKNTYKAGENVELRLASATALTVTVDIEKNHNIIKTQVIQLDDSHKTIFVPVTLDDIGGFNVHYSYAAFNSYQSGSITVNVPYPKTELQIEIETFRDKLQPGQDETWRFKIKGPKGDKVSAEILASMYDMSLDQFKPHSWNFDPNRQPNYYSYSRPSAAHAFGLTNFYLQIQHSNNLSAVYQAYDRFNWFGLYFNRYHTDMLMRKGSGIQVNAMAVEDAEMELEESIMTSADREEVNVGAGTPVTNQQPEKNEASDFNTIQIRKNLQETAFFYPHLMTDEEGQVTFSFTTPEALTTWKLQLVGHTKSLESATAQYETITQKELMVIPNVPRFLREGDRITISSKIANLTDTTLTGEAKLELIDAITGNTITATVVSSSAIESFSVNANGNTQVSWQLTIPDKIQAVQYKVLAKAANFSDGEQNVLPILTNRMLVTESLPMWIRSEETRTFTLDKLKTTTSSTLNHHKLTLEVTSNPAWYAVQALPYLMEFPYECNEQIFSRYYANALATHISNSNPRIQEVFNQWKNSDALLSNLEKNQELKALLIEETPWLRDAQSEAEQKKRIALLFDINKMKSELQSSLRKIESNQMASGAWSWFQGGWENRWITQHIITGFGHLAQLGVSSSTVETSMITKAISYLDAQFVKEYNDLKKYNKDVDLDKDHLSYTQLHYLYMRSFYPDIEKSKEVDRISDYYLDQIKKYWLSRSLYAKGLMALVSYRMDDKVQASKILKSLLENSITSEELGMYWKENSNSWKWYEAPIETQALLIETFAEVGNTIQNEAKQRETIDNLKIWLLKNKQTNSWKTTKATTEAVYALLLQGSDWLSVTDMVDVLVGGEEVLPTLLEDVTVEAGTGYFKTSWKANEIKPEMAEVQLSKKGDGVAWGALYWQYFEDLDKISSAETPLKLKKKLFLKQNTDRGQQLTEITAETQLKVGDLISVRIELRSDRDMEFVHMKDMRASGMEPINVLSQYKWQDGLGYYESTKDASTNFFFDYLPKGIYVFEYELRVTNAGDMSNGVTTIQSMYAPEFSSHSEGIRISVER